MIFEDCRDYIGKLEQIIQPLAMEKHMSNDSTPETRIKAAMRQIDRIFAGEYEEPFPRTELLKVFLDAFKAGDRTALYAMWEMTCDLPDNSDISINWLFEVAFKQLPDEIEVDSPAASQPVGKTPYQQQILDLLDKNEDGLLIAAIAKEVELTTQETLHVMKTMFTAKLVGYKQTPDGYIWKLRSARA
jgi:hypothetical protein